ncbi:hypothetical protein CCR85_11880 [Rhodothalassium salexigens]|uniref:hypothetical protein n=1 Tax=Rhodothalassium salexigens TaxID=1086 RepID=UPI001912B16C|nr:hypothetical protein [Rhodothalassium salexigens]MBK5912188.1 hypothetical protein [Rhodothalassium salexigens]MBK5919942.1 hypothetical protein [Rhodothalassium salexigens]
MDTPHTPLVRGGHFKLDTFAANCASGLAVTRAPGRWTKSWENDQRPARTGDRPGLGDLLAIARWIGHGGDPLVATPEQVADDLTRMAETGFVAPRSPSSGVWKRFLASATRCCRFWNHGGCAGPGLTQWAPEPVRPRRQAVTRYIF